MVTAGAIPDDFADVTVLRGGAAGRAWLDRLPAIVDACARRWGLTLDAPIIPLSYNYIVPARRADGTSAILKVCVPGGEFALQVEALRLFDGHGAVRVLASDRDDEVMLLEGCESGTLRRETIVDDDRATAIACGVMRQLWRPAPPDCPFPTMSDWNADLGRLRPHYGGGTGPFPLVLIEEMETLLAELTASAPAPLLLHGDLHYDNILPARRQPWLAIDPKGLTGEPAYEAGVLLYNPYPLLLGGPDSKGTIARRVDRLADELSLDRARVRGWGLVRAVLSAWWHVESTGHVRGAALSCAVLLASIDP